MATLSASLTNEHNWDEEERIPSSKISSMLSFVGFDWKIVQFRVNNSRLFVWIFSMLVFLLKRRATRLIYKGHASAFG
jgi:hypothetical protein